MASSPAPLPALTLALIGDVHDLWTPEDGESLHALGVDLALFVGDFGNEAVEVVRAIARLNLPKAAIFGNHDAWYSATEWGRKKCPYDRQQEDRVQQQLDALGAAHVGYGKLDFPEWGLSVVGGRPFSWGGSEWRNAAFYETRYGIDGFEASAQRILEAVRATTTDTLLFIGHCGPKGLGDRPEDPCGKDWKPIGGDFGDPDLAEAIAQTKALGKAVPLVGFGHMHHALRHTKKPLRRCVHLEADTVYLNAARVPRIVNREGDRRRNFTLVQLVAGQVVEARLVWVNAAHQICAEEGIYTRPDPVVQSASSESLIGLH
jgi:uncharacterized protein (TIGR04168 family)